MLAAVRVAHRLGSPVRPAALRYNQPSVGHSGNGGCIEATERDHGLLQITLNKVQFPSRTEDVWEVYPWISLVPHKSGIINAHLKPRNELDMERLIRVGSR
jgi:hypothetical protein